MAIHYPGMLPIESDVEMKAFEDKCFNAWLAKVSEQIDKLCSLSIDDLDDYCYREAYEDGQTPSMVARHAIKNSGG